MIRKTLTGRPRAVRTARAVATAAVSLGLALMAALTFAAPATAGSVPAWIDNHTGRHLGGARFSHGSSKCKVWNYDGNDDSTSHYGSYRCQKVTVQPHTNTGTWDDMDAVTVFSSSYYYIRWALPHGRWAPYHKVSAGVYTRFHGLHTAKCYSGTRTLQRRLTRNSCAGPASRSAPPGTGGRPGAAGARQSSGRTGTNPLSSSRGR